MADLLRAHSESVRRRLPGGWHGKLYGRGYVGRFRGLPLYVDRYTPWPGQVVSIDMSAFEPRGYRPLSTRAVTAARPLLDRLQAETHTGRHG